MRRFLAGLCLVVAATASAQLRPPLFTLRPVIGSVEDRFGNGLAVTRSWVLVAGLNEDYPGAATFYDLRTGAPFETLVSPEPSENDAFGYRVAATRRLAAVASLVPAVIRVYDSEQRPLGAIDGCGWTASLAMRGRRIAAVTECGILVADWPTGQWTLDAPAGAGAIALDAHRVFVGASGHVIALDALTGAVLWDVTAPDGTPGDGFGTSLAVVGGRILVGAPGDDADGSNTGAVYLLDGATGRLRRRYPNPVRESDAGFGFSVAGGRRVVLVGAPYATIDEPGAGAGYLLDARTGVLLDVLAPAPNEEDANAGRAVAVTSTRLLVGGSDWSGIGLVGVWER